jgi:hypothetical protein
MVPRIPCELNELASSNPPVNIKAHSTVRAFRFAFIIFLSCAWLCRANAAPHLEIARKIRVLRILSTRRPCKNVSDSVHRHHIATNMAAK